MVYRVFVEKRNGLTLEADRLLGDLRELLGIRSLKGVRVLNRYDVEGIDQELFCLARDTVFSEPPPVMLSVNPAEEKVNGKWKKLSVFRPFKRSTLITAYPIAPRADHSRQELDTL